MKKGKTARAVELLKDDGEGLRFNEDNASMVISEEFNFSLMDAFAIVEKAGKILNR